MTERPLSEIRSILHSPTTQQTFIMADDKTGKPAKPTVRGKGKGKALNAIAAASGRDPAAIVKSVNDAETAAKAAAARAKAEEEAKRAAAIAEAERKAREEVTSAQIYAKLSPEEQYRFECFRRCGFASKPIETFVAGMLVEESKKRYLARRGAMVGLGASLSGGGLDGSGDSTTLNTAAAVTDTSDVDSSITTSKNRKKQSKKQLLREESKRRRAAMDQPPPYFLGAGTANGNGSSVGGGHSSGGVPPLDNLVVPESASEIVAVVSTLAKCYGQRLVAAAKRVADAEDEENKLNGTADSSSSSSSTPTALQPHHFMEAHRHRSRAGVDPGFWMADRISQSSRSSNKVNSSCGGSNGGGGGVAESAALGTVDRDRMCYLAALAAQDAYDKEAEEEYDEGHKKEEHEKEDGNQQSTNECKMEVDT